MGCLTWVEKHSGAESVKPQFQSIIYFKNLFFPHIALKFVQPLQFRKGSSTDQWNHKVVPGKPIYFILQINLFTFNHLFINYELTEALFVSSLLFKHIWVS